MLVLPDPVLPTNATFYPLFIVKFISFKANLLDSSNYASYVINTFRNLMNSSSDYLIISESDLMGFRYILSTVNLSIWSTYLTASKFS